MNPIIRNIARGLIGLAVCLILISTLAGLSGCGGSAAPEPPPGKTVAPIDCGSSAVCT